MKKACNVYNNVDKINKIILDKTKKNFGENICYMNLEVENIVNNIITFNFNHNIIR